MGPDNGSLSYHKLHGSNKKQRILPSPPLPQPERSLDAAGHPRARAWGQRHEGFPKEGGGGIAPPSPQHPLHPFPCPLKAHFLCSTAFLLSASLSLSTRAACCTIAVVLRPVLTVPRMGEKQLLVHKQDTFSFFCSRGKRPFHSLLPLPGSRLGAFCV